MYDVFSAVNDVIRWAVPVTGLVITFLAWKRFRSPGIRIAVAAFALMTLSPVIRLVIRGLLEQRHGLTAEELGLISIAAAAVSLAGLILIVFTMRRMIATAESAAESGPPEGEAR